jgi:hypothetical protein
MPDDYNQDKQHILTQARALCKDQELYYSTFILCLADSIPIEQFKSISDAALAASSPSRSLFED